MNESASQREAGTGVCTEICRCCLFPPVSVQEATADSLPSRGQGCEHDPLQGPCSEDSVEAAGGVFRIEFGLGQGETSVGAGTSQSG